MSHSGKTFRIFVSSTFRDTVRERNALQERVFPELQKRCSDAGCRFQAIDLRWGVTEEAGNDHRAMEICLSELKRCQKVTPRPNFLVLLGERYGWVPIPTNIPQSEMQRMEKQFTEDENAFIIFDENDKAKNESEGTGWYRLDTNAVPLEYCLQTREAHDM